MISGFKKTAILLLALLCFLTMAASVDFVYDAKGQVKGRKIYEADGRWLGLYNANPDPKDEPWIISPLPQRSPEQQAEYEQIPVFVAAPQALDAQAITVNHTLSPFFRPVFRQLGGSCGQASGIGYHYSFERNQALNRPYGGDVANISAYDFIWNIMNGGENTGSWPDWGYQVAMVTGVARMSDFTSGGDYSLWMHGYPRYLRALECHVARYFRFNKGDTTSMKAWIADKGKGTGSGGGLITFACAWPLDTTATIPDGPYKGQKVVKVVPMGFDHAMTLAGYSDEITVDGKTGAFRLVNSHGEGWGDGGMIWVMYDGFDKAKDYSFTTMEVASQSPQLLIKTTLTSNVRNTLEMETGFNPAPNAATPSETLVRKWAYNLDGGPNPMQGKGRSPTLEMALDATHYQARLPGGKGTLFLRIKGTGSVDALSVVYLGTTPAREFVYSGPLLGTISGTRDFGVTVDLSGTSLRIVSPNGGEMWRKGEQQTISWMAEGLTQPLTIELVGPDNSVQVIANGISTSATSYTWTVGQLGNGSTVIGPGWKIRIRSGSASAIVAIEK